MKEKKKIIIFIICLILILILVGVVFATINTNKIIENIVKSGTVQVESINIELKDSKGNVGKEIADWEPGDVNQITWNVKNIGTSAVYTRNKLQIYWNEDVFSDEQYIYLYPANMTREQIIEDFNRGENSTYAIKVTNGKINVAENISKQGIEYDFLGDVLDGSKMTDKSKEVNYNVQSLLKTTDDDNAKEDVVSFKIMFSPKTSYLYEGKTVTVKVITEAMQFTEDGKAEWQIVDTQTIGG